MIDINKNYWFCFETYVYVDIKHSAILVYNTLDGKFLKSIDSEIVSLFSSIFEEDNCGIIKVTSKDLKQKNIYDFIEKIRSLYMGDLYDISLSLSKPVQLYPLLDFNSYGNKVDQMQKRIISENLLDNLYNLQIYINLQPNSILSNKCSNNSSNVTFDFYYLSLIISQLNFSNKFCVDFFMPNNISDSYLNDFISILSNFYFNKSITLYWGYFSKKNLDLLLNIFCDNINIVIPNNLNDFSIVKFEKNIEKINFIFEIDSIFLYESVMNIVSKFNINKYQMKPKYTGNNWDFFKKEVFLNENDIFATPKTMNDIFRNQTLNVYDFGKLVILPNADVYANINFEKLGNLRDNLINELIFLELSSGKSWLRTREKEPCNKCIYQWFCPSPSEYELALDKFNMCNIC